MTRTRARRSVATCVVAAILVLSGPLTGNVTPAGASGNGTVAVATCVLKFPTVRFSPAIGLVPRTASISIAGSGTCVINNHALVPIWVSGLLYSVVKGAFGVGCLTGEVSGLGTIGGSAYFPTAPNVTITAVNHGGTWTVVFTKTNSAIVVGTGMFEQAAGTTLACKTAAARVSATTWTGGALLFDPVLPEP